jgi:hypothetical protein
LLVDSYGRRSPVNACKRQWVKAIRMSLSTYLAKSFRWREKMALACLDLTRQWHSLWLPGRKRFRQKSTAAR